MIRGPEPEVSVVLATRNRLGLLRESLDSALGQDGVAQEVLVVDDASTDGTPAFLEAISDPRLAVLRQADRQGVSAARNRGIAAARGKWVAFLDDDDRWLPRRLRATLDTARRSEADFAYGDTILIDATGRPIGAEKAPDPEEFTAALRHRSPIWGPSALIASADVLQRAGGFDPALSYLADWDLWLRLAAIGRPARCAQPLVEYRLHAGGMLFGRGLDLDREFALLCEKHGALDRSHLVRAAADRYRREGLSRRASALYLREGARTRSAGTLARGVALAFGEPAMRLGRWARRRTRR